jgi:hypothetical protein
VKFELLVLPEEGVVVEGLVKLSRNEAVYLLDFNFQVLRDPLLALKDVLRLVQKQLVARVFLDELLKSLRQGVELLELWLGRPLLGLLEHDQVVEGGADLE